MCILVYRIFFKVIGQTMEDTVTLLAIWWTNVLFYNICIDRQR